MSVQLWQGVVPSISAREGVGVTATVMRTGAGIEIAYSFDDPEQRDIEDMVYDAEVAAHIAEQLALVQSARRACEALSDARERIHQVYDECVDIDAAECGRAETAHAQALVEYTRTMAALPHSLL